MRAKLNDKRVCTYCNGTGTEVLKMGRFTVARPCARPVPENTPAPEPLFGNQPSKAIVKGRAKAGNAFEKKGNRWHTKN